MRLRVSICIWTRGGIAGARDRAVSLFERVTVITVGWDDGEVRGRGTTSEGDHTESTRVPRGGAGLSGLGYSLPTDGDCRKDDVGCGIITYDGLSVGWGRVGAHEGSRCCR